MLNAELCLVQVNPDVLNLLLDYCRFHRAPGRSDKVGLTRELCVASPLNHTRGSFPGYMHKTY